MARECFAILDRIMGKRGWPVIKCVEGVPGFTRTHEEIMGSEETANAVVEMRNAHHYGISKDEAEAIVRGCQDLTKGRNEA